MKRWVVFLLVSFSLNNFSQTNISPHFSELKGTEDQQSNTHLFYRIQTSYENPPLYQWSNHIYHLDLFDEIDTLFISVSGYEDPNNSYNKWVSDVDYWNNNPSEFIYSGGITFGQFFEGNAYITRFDGYTNNFGLFQGFGNYVDISTTNDSLLYAGIYTDGGPGILQSLNGGKSWDSLSTDYQFLSLCPSNENIYFVENVDRQLLRTTDVGNSFYVVDPEFLVDTRFSYDPDGSHIYRKSVSKLLVSNNLGEQFSWQVKYETQNPFYLSLDESISGTIYLAENRNIFVSADYGDNFNLLKTLDRNIVGIYKKPNSEFLFAATKYRIYQIDLLEDSLKIIKSITPASENYDWFPIKVGNLWAYENYYTENGISYFAGYSWNWIDDSIVLQNGLEYFRMIERLTNGDKDTVYLRLDSLTAIMYAYSDETAQDLLFEDLSAELGDSVCYEYNYFWGCPFVQSEEQFSIWGLNTFKKDFYPNYSGWVCDHSLVKGIGLFHQGCGDLTTYYSNLICCVINGVVYGDTSTVDIEDVEKPVANDLKLEQNYPNPFNPSTVISYRLPVTSNVILKVFDVLGNEIATLVNEEKSAGEYEVYFSGHSGTSQKLPSGVYFYQLKAGSFVQTKKMILLK